MNGYCLMLVMLVAICTAKAQQLYDLMVTNTGHLSDQAFHMYQPHTVTNWTVGFEITTKTSLIIPANKTVNPGYELYFGRQEGGLLQEGEAPFEIDLLDTEKRYQLSLNVSFFLPGPKGFCDTLDALCVRIFLPYLLPPGLRIYDIYDTNNANNIACAAFHKKCQRPSVDIALQKVTVRHANNHYFRLGPNQIFLNWTIVNLSRFYVYKSYSNFDFEISFRLEDATTIRYKTKITNVDQTSNDLAPETELVFTNVTAIANINHQRDCLQLKYFCLRVSPAVAATYRELNDINNEFCIPLQPGGDAQLQCPYDIQILSFEFIRVRPSVKVEPDEEFPVKVNVVLKNASPYDLQPSPTLQLHFLIMASESFTIFDVRSSTLELQYHLFRGIRAGGVLILNEVIAEFAVSEEMCDGKKQALCAFVSTTETSAVVLVNGEKSRRCIPFLLECVNQGMAHTLKIGLGVGIPVVVLLIVVNCAAIWKWKSIKRGRRRDPFMTNLTCSTSQLSISPSTITMASNITNRPERRFRKRNELDNITLSDDDNVSHGADSYSPLKNETTLDNGPVLEVQNEHLPSNITQEDVSFMCYTDIYNRPSISSEHIFICMVKSDIRDKQASDVFFRKQAKWTIPIDSTNNPDLQILYSATGTPESWEPIYGDNANFAESTSVSVNESGSKLTFITRRVGLFAIVKLKEKLRRHLLVFLKPIDIELHNHVFLQMFAVKKDNIKAVEHQQLRDNARLCSNSEVTFDFKSTRVSGLKVKIYDVQPTNHWWKENNISGVSMNISYENLCKGDASSQVEVKFTKDSNSKCSSIRGKIKVQHGDNGGETSFDSQRIRREVLNEREGVSEALHGHPNRGNLNRSYRRYDPTVEAIEQEVVPDEMGLYSKHHVKPATRISPKIEVYDMTGNIKGRAYILNNFKFDRETQLTQRNGSDVDFDNAIHLFEELGYQIERARNQTAEQINVSIKEYAASFNGQTKYKSSVVFLMSHGNNKGIFGTDGKQFLFNDLYKIFDTNNCPQLEGKPKLFFIQACRNEAEVIRTADASQQTELEHENEDVTADTKNADIMADMCMFFATVYGFVSLRHEVNGSWFVQAVVEVFLAQSHENNLGELMTMVRNRVWKRRGRMMNPATQQMENVRALPEATNLLTKKFHFLPVGSDNTNAGTS